ncbi:MAG: protease HtpX [Vicinamibacterales bacterium]
MKRIVLFVATNIAVLLGISLVLSVLGVAGVRIRGGFDYTSLMAFCLLWGMVGSFISLQLSRWMAKRIPGMRLVDGRTGNEEADWVYRTVQRLAQQSQLPMPEVGVYMSPEVNAFATGPSESRSLVAVSQGLLNNMRRDEVEGVLAHEMSHIKNGDMVTMTLIQGVVNSFVMFGSIVLASVIRSALRGNSRDDRDDSGGFMIELMARMVLQMAFGLLGMVVVGWFSRQREFRADAGAATLTGRGPMIAALRRLQGTPRLIDTREPALATMKIAGVPAWTALISTHPPLEQRIAALEQLR